MKAIMISAPNSNSGKTVITAALLHAMQKKGFNVCGFKTGPDQVDRKILEYASGKKAGNLDAFLMTETGMEISCGIMNSDYAIIEGVMGCFDGIGTTQKNSSFEIASGLNINIILTYTPSGEMFSMIPKIKGLLDFSKNRIKGIILNKINASMYSVYKKMLEENLGICVLGFFPENSELKIDESNLGLSLNTKFLNTHFLNSLDTNIGNIDLEKFITFFDTVNLQYLPLLKPLKVKVAIAADVCANLCYAENIAILEKYANVTYFSLLNDYKLPDCDFLYLSGGQIKEFLPEISNNKSMLESIKKFAERDGFILAEGEIICCLFSSFDGFPMCGIFSGEAESTAKLCNFGYKMLELKKDCILGKKGDKFYAAEYHKSKAAQPDSPVFKVTKISTETEYNDGYAYKNTLAFFQNINFVSCIDNIYNKLLLTIQNQGMEYE